jgi:arabinose-5-phosphate isomerase
MKVREFGSNDFAKFHPGGALGKKVALKVQDVMNTDSGLLVSAESSILEVISKVSQGRMGAVAIAKVDGVVLGIITDGDIRRMLEKSPNFSDLTAKDIMNVQPKYIGENVLAVEAFRNMESNSITQLLVLEEGQWRGMVHLHDLLREGIF